MQIETYIGTVLRDEPFAFSYCFKPNEIVRNDSKGVNFSNSDMTQYVHVLNRKNGFQIYRKLNYKDFNSRFVTTFLFDNRKCFRFQGDLQIYTVIRMFTNLTNSPKANVYVHSANDFPRRHDTHLQRD